MIKLLLAVVVGVLAALATALPAHALFDSDLGGQARVVYASSLPPMERCGAPSSLVGMYPHVKC